MTYSFNGAAKCLDVSLVVTSYRDMYHIGSLPSHHRDFCGPRDSSAFPEGTRGLVFGLTPSTISGRPEPLVACRPYW